MEIKEIKEKSTWRDFQRTANPNTFLQSWAWGDVQTNTGENLLRLGIFNDEQLIAVAQVIIVNAKRGKHYLIPHGPTVKESKYYKQGISELTKYLKRHASKEKICALRIAPLVENTSENINIYRTVGFKPAPIHVHAELTWVLDINKPAEEILSSMRKTTRHAIKKAQSENVTTQIIVGEKALDRFMPLYTSTKQRHRFTPFSREFLREQIKAFHEQAFFVIARYKKEDVAAAILIQHGTTVFYHHGASIKTSNNVPAAQLLQWTAINEAKKRGATSYNFWGIAPDNQPNHPFAGITIFKKGFGGYAIDYMHAQDLPLLAGYWKLWLIDYYRKLKRGF